MLPNLCQYIQESKINSTYFVDIKKILMRCQKSKMNNETVLPILIKMLIQI